MTFQLKPLDTICHNHGKKKTKHEVTYLYHLDPSQVKNQLFKNLNVIEYRKGLSLSMLLFWLTLAKKEVCDTVNLPQQGFFVT